MVDCGGRGHIYWAFLVSPTIRPQLLEIDDYAAYYRIWVCGVGGFNSPFNIEIRRVMNITAEERKIYNKVKHLQIAEDDITPVNFGLAAFRAGQLDMAKLLMKLRNGELSEYQLRTEVATLDNHTEMVN